MPVTEVTITLGPDACSRLVETCADAFYSINNEKEHTLSVCDLAFMLDASVLDAVKVADCAESSSESAYVQTVSGFLVRKKATP